MIELRQEYDLATLLNITGIAKSSFYYHQQRTLIKDKYQQVKGTIKSIYYYHKEQLHTTWDKMKT